MIDAMRQADHRDKDRSPAELESDFEVVARVNASRGPQAAPLTTLLEIGKEDLVVLEGQGDKPDSVHRLELGTARIARAFFRHDLPTAHEIERAIDFTEDTLMRLGRPAQVVTALFSMAESLRPWVSLSGPTTSLELVEQWFQRLVSASLGQAGAMQGLPTGRQTAATLLVLREFMHHRGHASLSTGVGLTGLALAPIVGPREAS